MIIRGGQIFVLEEDLLPRVTITNAMIIMECTDASLEGMKDFICARIARGSEISNCTFVPLSHWSEQKMKEGIQQAKTDLNLKQAPVLKGLRKFLRFGAES